jgi:chitinase
MSFTVLSLTVLSILQRVTSLAPTSGANVAAAWYAGWHATEGFPISDISWDKYNALIYSFA